MAALRTRSHLATPRSLTAKGFPRVRASGADLLETSSVAGERRFKLCQFLPPLDGDIDITRLVFDAISEAADFLGRQNDRARTCELIERHVAAPRTIEKRISDERDGLCRRMGGERLHPTSPEGIDARVGPNVGAITTETAQFDIVSVWMAANPEDADQFMLRTVERALAGVRLVPDHEVQHGPIELASNVDQIADVAPVHADVMDRPFSRDANAIGERFNEELSKLRRGHFAGGESEFGMSNPPAAADLAHPQVVWRIAKHRRRRCALHQAGEVGGFSRIAAQEPVFSQSPQIPASRCRIPGQSWQEVFWLRPRGGHISQEQVALRRLKPGQRNIEALGRHKVDQLAELDRQDFAIPTGLFGEFVVGDHIGALLRRGEMAEPDNRRMSQSFQLRRFETAMAGKNHVGVVDDYRI